MTGFSPDWLLLREPTDHLARNEAVAKACAQHFMAYEKVQIVDLGCGSGSNLRALGPQLGPQQSWRLVDYDANLLAAAKASLQQWAQAWRATPQGLILQRDGRTIEVAFVQADLANGVLPLLTGTDLVTAAAFFDLCATSWIDEFVAAIASRKIPLMASLTYDGREVWQPPHKMDAAILAAFHHHQLGDKGLGAAAGPKAASYLVQALARHGFNCVHGASDWVLGAADAKLIYELARGSAQAVRDAGDILDADIEKWLAAREQAKTVRIGHEDVFAAL